jgi:hypothetical protein
MRVDAAPHLCGDEWGRGAPHPAPCNRYCRLVMSNVQHRKAVDIEDEEDSSDQLG